MVLKKLGKKTGDLVGTGVTAGVGGVVLGDLSTRSGLNVSEPLSTATGFFPIVATAEFGGLALEGVRGLKPKRKKVKIKLPEYKLPKGFKL